MVGRLYLLFLVLGLSLFIVWHFHRSFERGNRYPEFSSLRYDPKGGSLLADILESKYDTSVEQNFLAMPEWEHLGPNDMVFMLGLDPSLLAVQDNSDIVTSLSLQGGRVFIGFDEHRQADSKTRNKKDKIKVKDIEKDSDKQEAVLSDNTLSNAIDPLIYNYSFLSISLLDTSSANASHTLASTSNDLETTLPWNHSTFLHWPNDSPWTVMLTHENRVVMAKRPFGQGEVIISTDSQWLSNEALATGRPLPLLQSIIGESSHFIIDESQLGLVDSLGIVDLISRYRLEGFLAAVAVVLVILMWSGLGMTPPKIHAEQQSSEPAEYGLTTLLKRHLSPKQVLGTLLEKWKTEHPKEPHGDERWLQLDEAMTLDYQNMKKSDEPWKLYNQWQSKITEEKS